MASTLYTSGTLVTSDSLNAFDRASYTQLTALGGTADNLTATGPVSMTAYLTGLRFVFTPSAPNTTNVTININGLGNRAITKLGNTLLIAGDLVAGKVAEIVYDGLGFQLLNPQTFNLTNSVPAANITGQVAVANGGTGASTAAQALINLGATGRLIGTQTITASGNYTPTAGTTSIVAVLVGGGGSGGGTAATGAGQNSAGGGGAAGATAIHRATAGFSGSAIVIGTGGAGAAGGSNNGTATTFLGVSAPGGQAGEVGTATNITSGTFGGSGTSISTGANIMNGSTIAGQMGLVLTIGGSLRGGPGAGSTTFGGSGAGSPLGAGSAPPANAYGAGGGGAAQIASSAALAGGSGRNGAVIIYEYS